ncbi:hypothetical protein [Mariniphaga anaerophila]|nr:hypothetical protein [Mariniphaga anaerophila]
MKNKILSLFLLMFLVAGISSCKKSEEKETPCSVAWATELSDELNAMAAAAQTFATNPTSANCNAYKQAAQAYLNALRPYGDCTLLTGQDRVVWQNAIDDAQESLDDMEC